MISDSPSLRPKRHYLKVNNSATMHKLNIPIKLLVCDSDYECFPLECVCAEECVWRQCQSCDSNHEAGSDPARSLSGFASFSSQGIFGIVVSDTLIVMGRPGCQWSAWISILLGSVSWALATWCNRSLSCLRCWLWGRCLLTHQVAYLWAEVESRGRFFFSSLSGPGEVLM